MRSELTCYNNPFHLASHITHKSIQSSVLVWTFLSLTDQQAQPIKTPMMRCDAVKLTKRAVFEETHRILKCMKLVIKPPIVVWKSEKSTMFLKLSPSVWLSKCRWYCNIIPLLTLIALWCPCSVALGFVVVLRIQTWWSLTVCLSGVKQKQRLSEPNLKKTRTLDLLGKTEVSDSSSKQFY